MLRHTEKDSFGNDIVVRVAPWLARWKMAGMVTPRYYLSTNRYLIDDYKDYFWARGE